MWREETQGEFPFPKCFTHKAELELLEISEAAMEHLRRPARRTRGDVPSLDQGNAETTGGGVERGPHADDPAPDDDEVELLSTQPAPRLGSVERPHIRWSVWVELGVHACRA
ncbi:hypothetical protein GCM10022238_00160 [Gordonia hankookensis]